MTWGERPYPGLCPSAVVELVKVCWWLYLYFLMLFLQEVHLIIMEWKLIDAVTSCLWFLQEGHRMERPNHCPPSLYSLMMDCWRGQVRHLCNYFSGYVRWKYTGGREAGLGRACDKAPRVGNVQIFSMLYWGWRSAKNYSNGTNTKSFEQQFCPGQGDSAWGVSSLASTWGKDRNFCGGWRVLM